MKETEHLAKHAVSAYFAPMHSKYFICFIICPALEGTLHESRDWGWGGYMLLKHNMHTEKYKIASEQLDD